MQTRGYTTKTVEISMNETDEGWEAVCPACNRNNRAVYGPEGNLAWYPTLAHCQHYTGAYSSGTRVPVAHFRIVAPITLPKRRPFAR